MKQHPSSGDFFIRRKLLYFLLLLSAAAAVSVALLHSSSPVFLAVHSYFYSPLVILSLIGESTGGEGAVKTVVKQQEEEAKTDFSIPP